MALRVLVRVGLGLFVILHALAHTVLLLRGELPYSPATTAQAVAIAGFLAALISLFAAGMGMLGSHVLRPFQDRLMLIGLAASVLALSLGWNDSSWWGLSIDAMIAGGYVAARNIGLLAVPVGPPPTGIRLALLRLREGVALALVAYVAFAAFVWPWHRQWGTTPAERRLELPGDRSNRNPNYELMHAVTIDAPPGEVWNWLVQLGQDRAGFYSYDWLERLFLADVHNVYEIRPEWQQRAAGDFLRATPPNYLGGIFGRDVGWTVSAVEPGRAMVLANWGAFVLEPYGSGQTRFYIRSSIGAPDAPVWGAGLSFALFELPHFIMERKMMLTIKACAERRVKAGVAESFPRAANSFPRPSAAREEVAVF
jgi:hypothetical protein